MQMNYGPDVRLVSLGAMDVVVNRQKVRWRQPVAPFHEKPLTTSRFQGRPRRDRIEASEPRWFHIPMHLAFDLPHCKAIVGKSDGWVRRTWAVRGSHYEVGCWKPIHKWGKQAGVE